MPSPSVPVAVIGPRASFRYEISAVRARGGDPPIRSANAPTNAAPDAASPAEQRAGVLRSDVVVQPLVVGQANHAAPVADLGHVEPHVTVEGDRLLEPLPYGFVGNAQRTSIGFGA